MVAEEVTHRPTRLMWLFLAESSLCAVLPHPLLQVVVEADVVAEAVVVAEAAVVAEEVCVVFCGLPP